MPSRCHRQPPHVDPPFAAYSAEQVADAIRATVYEQADVDQSAQPELRQPEVERYMLVARTAGRAAFNQAAESSNGLELMQRLSRYAETLMGADDARFVGTPW